mmetsp:Transcript_12734/g.18077  ORF Transcript_12734/g.18077 Transcript_12734/m.18077 type:complete len:416 (+) Transcript_12734:140-1387(+)
MISSFLEKCGPVFEKYASNRLLLLCSIVFLSNFPVSSFGICGARRKFGDGYSRRSSSCDRKHQVLSTYMYAPSRRRNLSMVMLNNLETNNIVDNTKSLYPKVIVPCDYQDILTCPADIAKNDWVQAAAMNLEQFGLCALVGGARTGAGEGGDKTNHDANTIQSLIDPRICDRTNDAAISRLDELQQKIKNRGVDPTGVEDGPFRFREVVCRDEGGRRYDMPVHWFGRNDNHGSSTTKPDLGTPWNTEQVDAIKEFHKSLDILVQPIMHAMWDCNDDTSNNDESSSSVAAAGFLINKPGSRSQGWHRDGPDEGYIDVFVPLVDLTAELGPTRLLPGTHQTLDEDVGDVWSLDDEKLPKVAPLLRKGQILLFDYRTLHKGLGNTSNSTSRTLAYCVYTRESTSDVQNFPDALTLEYD